MKARSTDRKTCAISLAIALNQCADAMAGESRNNTGMGADYFFAERSYGDGVWCLAETKSKSEDYEEEIRATTSISHQFGRIIIDIEVELQGGDPLVVAEVDSPIMYRSRPIEERREQNPGVVAHAEVPKTYWNNLVGMIGQSRWWVSSVTLVHGAMVSLSGLQASVDLTRDEANKHNRDAADKAIACVEQLIEEAEACHAGIQRSLANQTEAARAAFRKHPSLTSLLVGPEC